jgi:hypothetical protein
MTPQDTNPQSNQPQQPSQPGAQQPQPQPQQMPDGSQVYNQPVPDSTPQLVFVTRPHEPMQPDMSPEQRKRHEDSKKKYSDLNLSDGEFIILAINRHPIGLLQIWAAVLVGLVFVFFAIFLLAGGATAAGAGGAGMPPEILVIPAVLVSALVLLFGFIATSIYNGNKFFLTNESVIQQIQTGIFAKKEQTVSLSNIEDASYNQHGILPHILNYGLIRLSTEGDETTYRFNYVANPRKQVGILNNAVEAFKNGRPVTGENDE